VYWVHPEASEAIAANDGFPAGATNSAIVSRVVAFTNTVSNPVFAVSAVKGPRVKHFGDGVTVTWASSLFNPAKSCSADTRCTAYPAGRSAGVNAELAYALPPT